MIFCWKGAFFNLSEFLDEEKNGNVARDQLLYAL